MSLNLITAIEQEDHNNLVRPMTITRLNAGLTSSATLSIGHIIEIGSIDFEVTAIRHSFRRDVDIAPVSTVIVKAHRPLSDQEIGYLRKVAGMRDM